MSKRRDTITYKDRAQLAAMRKKRCRQHRCVDCSSPRCIRDLLTPKKVYHKGDARPGEHHGRRSGDLRGFRAENRLEVLFRSLWLPRVEIEPYPDAQFASAPDLPIAAIDSAKGANHVYSDLDRKKSVRELIKQSQ